jgi:hypothetical protein
MYPSKTPTLTESSRLSLTTAGSSMNAALGNVSAGGIGTPEFEVTHNGGGPCAFVAIQPNGNAGTDTASKFSVCVVCCQQGLHGGGLGALTAKILFSATRWPTASEELIAPNTASTAATKESGQKITRNRSPVNMRFRFAVME